MTNPEIFYFQNTDNVIVYIVTSDSDTCQLLQVDTWCLSVINMFMRNVIFSNEKLQWNLYWCAYAHQ